MAHLSPTDDELRAAHEEGSKKMAEAVSRIGIISLTSTDQVYLPHLVYPKI